VLSTTEDMARLRAEEAVEAGGDGRGCPLRVVDFEARVEGISLAKAGVVDSTS
jgi:hypothetical protein